MSRIVRLVHRWLAPFFIVAMIAVMSTGGPSAQGIPQMIQQMLMLTLAISGAYLFVLPLWTKWQRKSKVSTGETGKSGR